MSDRLHDAAALADRDGLARTYRRVFEFVGRRARGGDQVAHGFERALTHAYLPQPAHQSVRRWLADVAASRSLVNRSSDPWDAERLLADMHAWEARTPGISETVWREVVTAIRSGVRS